MIHDTLQHAPTYHPLSPRIAAALRFLASPDARTLPLGKHLLDGENLFALVQEYTTQPASERFWEAHRRYIDIQFIVAGTERIGIAPIDQLQITDPYDPARDLVKLETHPESPAQFITLPAGTFAIFFPHDAHMPCVAINTPQPVRKIVMKVAVDNEEGAKRGRS